MLQMIHLNNKQELMLSSNDSSPICLLPLLDIGLPVPVVRFEELFHQIFEA